MRNRSFRPGKFFGIGIAIGASAIASAQWTVTNLHPAGQAASFSYAAFGTQQGGQISLDGFFPRASIWSGSGATQVDLNPEGARDSLVVGTSGTNQVGFAFFEGDMITRASLWSGTAASWVSLHPAGAEESYARGIAGAQQVGYADFGTIRNAGLWSGTAGSWVSLHPAGAGSSEANATSGTQQVGFANIDGVSRASLWSGTAASRVDLHPAGADGSSALAISGSTQAGWALISGVSRAGTWSGTAASWNDLHPAPSTWSLISGAFGNQQVGQAMINGNFHASWWNGTTQSWVDLSTFLPGSWRDSYAQGIWSDGTITRIAGYGFNLDTGRYEALLWTRSDPNAFTLALNKSSVAGQNSVLGTITLGEIKPVNTVFTTYDNSSLVETPPSVTVLAGQISRGFQIKTTAITSTISTVIYASRLGVTRSQTLVLMPLIPTAVVCTPNPVTGGSPTTARVVINGVAGPGGRVIAVFDNSSYTTMPSTVTVPPGGTDVTFTITTTPVTVTQSVVLTARVSAGEKTGNYRIRP